MGDDLKDEKTNENPEAAALAKRHIADELAHGKKKKDVAIMLGLSQPTISSICKGSRGIGQDVMQVFANHFYNGRIEDFLFAARAAEVDPTASLASLMRLRAASAGAAQMSVQSVDYAAALKGRAPKLLEFLTLMGNDLDPRTGQVLVQRVTDADVDATRDLPTWSIDQWSDEANKLDEIRRKKNLRAHAGLDVARGQDNSAVEANMAKRHARRRPKN